MVKFNPDKNYRHISENESVQAADFKKVLMSANFIFDTQ